MEILNLLAQADGQELAGRVGDGVILGKVALLAIGFAVGLMAGWLGLKRPKWLGGN